MSKRIITIGRECGSGGHTIGKRVAERLGIAFYDKEIVELVAAKTKLSPDFIDAHGEYFRSGSLGHIIGYGGRFTSPMQTQSSLQDHMHFVQTSLIRELAEGEACVIVGRCADYILQERSDCLNVFIHSDLPYKVERSVREHGLPEGEAAGILSKRDKARAQHYSFYTSQTWGMSQNYHLTLHSGFLGEDTCVDLLCAAYER